MPAHPRRRSVAARLVARSGALALATLVGCSFALTAPPDPYEPSVEPECDSSRGLPIADFTMAVLFSAVAIVAATSDPCVFCAGADQSDPRTAGRVWVVGYAAGAVAFGGSGLIGWRKTDRCREAHRRREAYLAQ
jgi:hypothetical protein